MAFPASHTIPPSISHHNPTPNPNPIYLWGFKEKLAVDDYMI